MQKTDSSPLETARRHVAAVASHLGLDATASENLRWAHEAALRTSMDGAVHYTDISGSPIVGADTAEWLRTIERTRPGLLGKTSGSSSKSSATSASSDLGKETITGLMVRARAGDVRASAELDRRGRGGDVAPMKNDRPNVTSLMIAAKRGDERAKEQLKKIGYF